MKTLWMIAWCWARLMRGQSKADVAVAALQHFYPRHATPEAIGALVRKHG